MSHQSELIESDIIAYLKQHEDKELLRFLTCGSVDDGKSTLIGRLLHDSKMIFEDQLAAIENDSKKVGTQGEKIDLALLVDGLQAEREQGITIDVAYRYFSTDKRKFIIADTPGHEQYTRNMATGASTCDLAVILIDARYGVQTQTRRHSFIASLLGIKHIVVAVNKMDLVEYSQQTFESIRNDYLDFAEPLVSKGNMGDIRFVPISALDGDNVVNASNNMGWYDGQTLMQVLETVELGTGRDFENFRFPVQYVNRPNLNFRGFSGTVASGVVKVGETLTALPSGKSSKVKEIVTFDGNLPQAFAGQAVTLTLEDEIDISRGDMLLHASNDSGYQPAQGKDFEAMLVWMAEKGLQPGRMYDIKMGSFAASAQVKAVLHQVNVNTLVQQESESLALNEIGLCQLSLSKEAVFDAYPVNRTTGSFILVDRLTNATVAAGMIQGAVEQEAFRPVRASERAARLGQRSSVVEISGVSPEQLSQIERELFDRGLLPVILPEPDQKAEELLVGSGLIVLTAQSGSSEALKVSASQHELVEELISQLG
ncbi:sulfate adenylyltransferase subunit CysN [Parendozoicomonas haliclonae]|uniref:Sulfate adenylyltransferase subunit 1 n=1 Tax=Parendozoicomonas haliclonae TaxID=1960125 RepID=A0A1X7AFN1_9GAMM|nr:sulfate adenylyltransferase subunit CysN [Parendozoicomonas haliclonae]SMA37098.1 Sulfate adenylyltransferase subunit 1 [Parendozoicomonas haliclonae]